MIHSPKIKTSPWAAETSNLHCPRCDSTYLHQKYVDIFGRGEDEKVVTHINVTNIEGDAAVSSARKDREHVRNPSSRRDGLVIGFWCEGCGGGDAERVLELTVAQHKGCTEIGWRFKEGS
ncbi:hypothetical protein [Rhizobium laguerreae]|uniref:hypothetical protein n=1 Tax=Rhizobium laguerreae TaxID=1076926 RepID=UPI001C913722|nr:hypothetical protein [Rhizobium laguerreae]MBY3119935.1 hypothetical protein [Rhizobium laguerreae]